MADNKVNPPHEPLTTDELLVILMEECAEVIQAASKCQRFGFTREHPEYGINDKVLAAEIGDVLAIVDALPLDRHQIEYFRKHKLAKATEAKEKYGRKQ